MSASFKSALPVPAEICGVVVASSWHAPIACAYERGHEGDHSWATIPQFAPTKELSEKWQRETGRL